jgi:hypothetical protein
MREKLRNYHSGFTQTTPDLAIERYYKEAKDLCKGFSIPHPMDFYYDLCVLAF